MQVNINVQYALKLPLLLLLLAFASGAIAGIVAAATAGLSLAGPRVQQLQNREHNVVAVAEARGVLALAVVSPASEVQHQLLPVDQLLCCGEAGARNQLHV